MGQSVYNIKYVDSHKKDSTPKTCILRTATTYAHEFKVMAYYRVRAVSLKLV